MATGVYFTLPGAVGHLNPSLPIVSELVSRGHRVVYYCGDKHPDVVASVGAEPRTYSRWWAFHHTADVMNDLLDLGHHMFDGLCTLPQPLVDDLAGDAIEFVVYDSAAPWGRLVAEKLGVPALGVTTHMAFHPLMLVSPSSYSVSTLRLFFQAMHLRTVTSTLRQARAMRRRGLVLADWIHPGDTGPGALLRAFGSDVEHVVTTGAPLQPATRWFGDRYEFVGSMLDTTSRPDDPALAAELAADDRPLVYVSMGTVHVDAMDVYRTVIDAVRHRPWRVLMSVGSAAAVEALAGLADNVILRDRVPQLQVLRAADTFVTHGGMNSVTEGLVFGVPMVVIPQQLEQSFNGQRLRKMGAGVVVPPWDATPSAVTAALDQVVANVAMRCVVGAAGRALDADGPRRAADRVEALLRGAGAGSVPAGSSSSTVLGNGGGGFRPNDSPDRPSAVDDHEAVP